MIFSKKPKNIKDYNNYLSHRNIDSFPRTSNWKIIRLIQVLLAPSDRRPELTKLELILWFLFCYARKIICNTMLYILFQYCWEPVLIQRIIIGFEAILEYYITLAVDVLERSTSILLTWSLNWVILSEERELILVKYVEPRC